MDKKELKSILEAGESQTVEFMEGFSDKFMREMVALANAEGGRILLGVNDRNEISGLDATNKLKSQVKDSARNCDPRTNRYSFSRRTPRWSDTGKLGRG